MARTPFDKCVFINCPFDEDHAPLLEAMVFCVISFGLKPRLATESLEAGQNRLEKIVALLKSSKYSIHDLSRCQATKEGEYFRLNMPFEYGIDYGLRKCGNANLANKRFVIFENTLHDLKPALSDSAGQDVFPHENDYTKVIKILRDFFSSEFRIKIPGDAKLLSEYETCRGWVFEKKLDEGHSEKAAKRLPTHETIDAMEEWINLGKPAKFTPSNQRL